MGNVPSIEPSPDILSRQVIRTPQLADIFQENLLGLGYPSHDTNRNHGC
jgi:hypothetical protein